MDIETSRQLVTVFYVKESGDIADIVSGQQTVEGHYGANGAVYAQIMGAITVPAVAGLWTEPERYKVRDGRLVQKMPDHYEVTADGDLVVSPPEETEPEIEPKTEQQTNSKITKLMRRILK